MSYVPALHHCSEVTLSPLGLELLSSRIFPEIYSLHPIKPDPWGLQDAPALLQNRVLFPAPQLPATPARRDPVPSNGTCGHCTRVHIRRETEI